MRKFSKILAVVLALTVICSAFAILASADAGATEHQLRPAGSTNFGYTDFENNGVNDGSYATGKGSDTGIKNGWTMNDYHGIIFDTKIKQQTNPDGTETNKYLSFDKKPLSKSDTASYWEYRVGDWSNKGAKYNNGCVNLKDYKYFVTEFDIACSKYQYKLDGSTYYGTTVPEGATDVKLAYPKGTAIDFIVRSSTGQKWVQFFIVSDGTDWYLSIDQSASPATDAKLSTVAGAWNHVSLIVESNYTDHTKSLQYGFVDGKFIGQAVTTGASDPLYSSPDTTRFTVPVDVTSNDKLDFNFSVDNITNYAYEDDYVSAGYGLDDFFADDYKNLSLTSCTDVAYNEYYTYIGTPNVPPITITRSNGTKSYYFMPGTAMKNIKDHDYIVTSFSFSNFTPALGINELTIKTIDGATVNLSAGASSLYKVQKYKDTYKIKLASPGDGITIKWLDIDGEPLLEQTLLPLITPDTSAPNYSFEPDLENFTANSLDGWTWDIDGAGTEYGEEAPRALTVSDFFELKQLLGIDTIEIKPQVSTTSLQFVIIGEDGTPYAPNGSYDIYSDFANFASIVSEAPDKSVVTLLSTDNSDGIFTVPANTSKISNGKGKTLTIDLNGFTLSHNSNVSGSGYGHPLFRVNEGGTLNLISSKPGGRIFQAQAHQDVNFGSSGVVEVPAGVDAAEINFGKPDGTCTVDVNGGSVVYILGSTEAATNKALENSKKIKVNIWGGSFYSNARPAYAMFAVGACDVEISINNANIYNAVSKNLAYGIFVDYPGYYCGGHKIVAKNSNIIAMSVDGTTETTIFARSSELEAYFENCVIMGSAVKTDNGGNITLGEGCTLAGTAASKLGTYFKVADGVNVATNKLDTFKTTVSLTYPGMHYDSLTSSNYVLATSDYALSTADKTAVIGAMTFTDSIPDSNIIPVNFYNPETSEIHATDYYFKGNTIDATTHAFSDFGSHKLNNGWYDILYDTWVNSTQGANPEDRLILEGVENKFTATASTPVVNVTAQTSAEFFDKLGYNFYFRIPEATDGVTFDYTGNSTDTGFFIGDTAIKNNITSETDMYKFSGYLAGDEFASPTVTVKFKVSYAGHDVTLEQSFAFDMFDYFYSASELYGCGSNEAKFLIALMQYKLEEYLAANPGATLADPTVLKCDNAIYSHGPNCTCLNVVPENLTFNNDELLITADSYAALLGNYIDIAYLINEDGKVDLVVYTAADSAITALSAAVGDAADTALTKSDLDLDGDGVNEVEYRLSGINVTDAADIITFTVTTAEGDETAKYCLAEEIDVNSDSVVAKVLYVIATTPIAS